MFESGSTFIILSNSAVSLPFPFITTNVAVTCSFPLSSERLKILPLSVTEYLIHRQIISFYYLHLVSIQSFEHTINDHTIFSMSIQSFVPLLFATLMMLPNQWWWSENFTPPTSIVTDPLCIWSSWLMVNANCQTERKLSPCSSQNSSSSPCWIKFVVPNCRLVTYRWWWLLLDEFVLQTDAKCSFLCVLSSV